MALLPLMGGLVLVAIAAPMLLGGIVISGKSINPDVPAGNTAHQHGLEDAFEQLRPGLGGKHSLETGHCCR
jgi:flagellar biosynthesis protein FlhB